MKVFITGVTSGLGKVLVKEFLNRGYRVWGIGRKHLEDSKENFCYSICDVSKEEDVKRVYEEMENKDFVPDIIILNAGMMKNDLISQFSYPVFKETFDINLFGAIKWIDVFLPLFLKRKKGTFAAISSLSAYRALVINKIAYPGSKAALSMVFEGFRLQVPSSGIRFITFHVGPMGEGRSLFQIGYQKAAEKIVNHLCRNKKNDVVNFPFIPTLITKISRFFPDGLLSKKILKNKKYLIK